MRGYLIRLTHGYMDGAMDSHADDERDNDNQFLVATVTNSSKSIFSANGRSAVHVFMREAG